MKLYFKFFVIVSAIGISLISCQKDFTIDDDLNPIDPPDLPALGDSIYLDKIYGIDVSASGVDTLGVFTFNYDANKRVLLLIDSAKDDSGNPLIARFRYFYNGTDTVPYKMVAVWDNLSTADDYDSTIAFYYYDATGRKLKDSILYRNYEGGTETTSLDIIKYSFGVNKMYGELTSTTFLPFQSTEVRRDTATLNASGDLVQTTNYVLNGTTFEREETIDFTYDNKINPFKYLSLFKAHYGFPYHAFDFIDYVAQANILTEKSLQRSGDIQTRHSTYQYNGLGLPVKQLYIFQQDSPDEERTSIVYTYKKL